MSVGTPDQDRTENELARLVVNECYQIHSSLGPGLFETVYEAVLERKLRRIGLGIVRQAPIAFEYEDMRFEEGFRADMIVGGKLLLELKSVERLSPVHLKQVMTYLKLTKLRLGLLINFGAETIKEGIKRIANGMEDTR